MDTSHPGFINQAAGVRRGQLQPIRGQCWGPVTNEGASSERAGDHPLIRDITVTYTSLCLYTTQTPWRGIPASRELGRSRGYNLVNHSHFVLASSPGSLDMVTIYAWSGHMRWRGWPLASAGPKHRVSSHQPSLAPALDHDAGTTHDSTCQSILSGKGSW